MPEYNIPVAFRFKVEFDGVPSSSGGNGATTASAPSTNSQGNNSSGEKDARFQEVSGLTMELGIETVDEGGVNGYSHRLPTRGKFENLVLKRGLLNDSGLISWIKDAIENFIFTPVTVKVILLNENHEPLATWKFLNVWPVKWGISEFKAQDNALVIETLELAYSNFTKES